MQHSACLGEQAASIRSGSPPPPLRAPTHTGHDPGPLKHKLLKKESQSDDGRCKSILPSAIISQLTDFPESLQLVEDGFYTPPGVWGKGEAREATRSYIGLGVLGGYTLLLFVLICIFVRLKDREHR
jgi:hypothetical protein